jgi:hypothetical protein
MKEWERFLRWGGIRRMFMGTLSTPGIRFYGTEE